jgi:hypothetical protein
MRFRIALGVIAAMLLLLLAAGGISALTQESIEDKMCNNQKFTLRQIDILAGTAQELVGVGSSRRTVDDTAAYLLRFEHMRDEINRRLRELDNDYC